MGQGLIDREQLSYSEWTDWLAAKITDEMAHSWSVTDPLVWIAESTAIRDRIYPASDTLSYRYQYDHIATIREQLQKGGVRIAVYLNQLFGR